MSPFLQIENIEKYYPAKVGKRLHVLKGISFTIHEGEIFGLLGVNGAGKTTLSSIIATLIKPFSGSVLYKGKSVYDNLHSFRQMLGFCPQKQNIDADLTLEENLYFSGLYYGMEKKAIVKRREHLLEKFNLKQYAKEHSKVLSGGYKQRFLIARSLMHNPKILILDEPTVGLDPHVRESLIDYIGSLKEENMTIILTTHYLEEAEKLSDRVCVIDQGMVKTLDTPSNLKKQWDKSSLHEVFLHLLKEKNPDEED